MRRPLVAAAALTLLLASSACGDDAATGSGGDGGARGPSGAGGAGDGGAAAETSTAAVTPPGAVGSGSSATTSASGVTAASSSSTGPGPLACSGADPSFAAEVQPIFTASCAVTNCHRGANPDKNLDLSDGAAWAEIVGVETEECNGTRLRVTPGQPEASYLVSKIRDEDLCGTSRRMPPPSRDLLPPDQIQTIVDWICSGAADD